MKIYNIKTRYKYTWDKQGKTFTQAEWLSLAIPHFTYKKLYFSTQEFHILIHEWNKHLEKQTIILANIQEENFWKYKSKVLEESIKAQTKGKEPINCLIGCTYCHHIHITEADGLPNKANKECLLAFNRRILS